MSTSAPGRGLTLRGLIGWVIGIDVVLSGLGATVNSLALYMGGDALGASAPATLTAAIAGWFLNFIVLAVVQGFIMCVGGVICAVLIGLFTKQAGSADGKGDEALGTLFKWGLRVDLVLSALAAVYNGSVQYGIFSVLGANATLNLVAAILSGLLTFVYTMVALGFIMTVGTLILGVLYFVFSGGMNKKPAGESEKK